jgi:hypothetical protein
MKVEVSRRADRTECRERPYTQIAAPRVRWIP